MSLNKEEGWQFGEVGWAKRSNLCFRRYMQTLCWVYCGQFSRLGFLRPRAECAHDPEEKGHMPQPTV